MFEARQNDEQNLNHKLLVGVVLENNILLNPRQAQNSKDNTFVQFVIYSLISRKLGLGADAEGQLKLETTTPE